MSADSTLAEVIDRRTNSNFLAWVVGRQVFWVTLATIVACVILTFTTNDKFASPGNIFNVTRNFAFVGIIAVGMTCVIITGGIDLSVGGTLLISAMVTAYVMSRGMPFVPALGLALLAAIAVGLVNGVLIAVFGMAPFVITLGMMSIARSLGMVISDNKLTYDFGPDGPILLAFGGGQAFGIVPGNERYVAAVTVGSQSGYWKHWRGAGRAGMWLVTHVVLPGLSRSLGYLPARWLGQGEDLPAGVAREWAGWCRHPGYIVGALGAQDAYARFTAPIRLYAIGDDAYAPPPAAEAFLGFYPNAPRQRIDVDPRQHGGPIGHFGFFRERFRDSLWKDTADWMESR